MLRAPQLLSRIGWPRSLKARCRAFLSRQLAAFAAMLCVLMSHSVNGAEEPYRMEWSRHIELDAGYAKQGHSHSGSLTILSVGCMFETITAPVEGEDEAAFLHHYDANGGLQ